MAGAAVSNSALQAQMDALREQVVSGFRDLKAMMQNFDEKLEKLATRVQIVENREAACSPLVQQRLSQAEQRLVQHQVQLEHLDKAVTELVNTNRILKWLLGILTAILTAGGIAFATRLWQMVMAP